MRFGRDTWFPHGYRQDGLFYYTVGRRQMRKSNVGEGSADTAIGGVFGGNGRRSGPRTKRFFSKSQNAESHLSQKGMSRGCSSVCSSRGVLPLGRKVRMSATCASHQAVVSSGCRGTRTPAGARDRMLPHDNRRRRRNRGQAPRFVRCPGPSRCRGAGPRPLCGNSPLSVVTQLGQLN
jgi:hypothetical protein